MARRTLLSLALYQLLASNRTGVFLAYFPLFLVDARGASVAVALAFTSAAYLGGSAIAPLAGRWSDRLGRRKPFLVGAELGALPFYLAIPFLPGLAASATSFVVGTTVLGMGSPALNAFVADTSRAGQRGGSYGTLTSASAFGSILGFLVVAALVDRFGFEYLFYFTVGVMAVTATYVLTVVEDVRAPRSVSALPIRDALPVALFSVAVSIRTLGTGAVGAFYGIWATDLGASYFEVGLIAVAGLGTTAVAAIWSGRQVDRTGEWRNLVWGSGISVLAWTAFLLAPAWYYLLGAQSLRQFGFTLLSPAMLVWVSRIAPAERRAEYLGLFTLINSGFWSLGPSAGGLAFELGGPPAVFLLAISVTLLSLVAIFAFQNHYRRTEKAASRGTSGPGPAPPGGETLPSAGGRGE